MATAGLVPVDSAHGYPVLCSNRCSNADDFRQKPAARSEKNDGETLTLSRWSSEQRRRRLHGNQEEAACDGETFLVYQALDTIPSEGVVVIVRHPEGCRLCAVHRQQNCRGVFGIVIDDLFGNTQLRPTRQWLAGAGIAHISWVRAT